MFERTRPGFTLLELIVVIAVLATLAALVAPNVFRHVGAARDVAARSQIAMLGAALDAFRLDVGRYPSTSEGLDALMEAPVGLPRGVWQGPYLRKSIPLDPWHRAYVYTMPSQHDSLSFALESLGADGMKGGSGDDADVTSWQ